MNTSVKCVLVTFLCFCFSHFGQNTFAQDTINCTSPTSQEQIASPVVDEHGILKNYRCFPTDVSIAVDTQTSQMSLKAFLHLNWPVSDNSGRPDYTKFIGQQGEYDNSAVWETWPTKTAIFRGETTLPSKWGDFEDVLPESCRSLDIAAEKALYPHRETVPAVLPPRFLTRTKDPQGHYVIDQSGEPLRFEVAMNRIAYDYIVKNNLFSDKGRQKWKASHQSQDGAGTDPKSLVSFPFGEFNGKIPGSDLSGAVRGAIVTKAAWKILADVDDPDLFHKAWAYVQPINAQGVLQDSCHLKAVGLVAMHIIYKTKNLDNDWGWATFEHTCAAPHENELQRLSTAQGSGGVATASEKCPNGWLFYQPDCSDCLPVNQPPGSGPGTKPSQILADWEPLYYCETCNTFDDHASEILKDSVWAKYQFVGTQWRDVSDNGAPSPTHLSSSILEAYLKPNTSCIGCHQGAGFDGVKGAADSVFMFFSASSKPKK